MKVGFFIVVVLVVFFFLFLYVLIIVLWLNFGRMIFNVYIYLFGDRFFYVIDMILNDIMLCFKYKKYY